MKNESLFIRDDKSDETYTNRMKTPSECDIVNMFVYTNKQKSTKNIYEKRIF